MIFHPYFLVPHSAPSTLFQVSICPQKPQTHVYSFFFLMMQGDPGTGSNIHCSPCQAGTKVQSMLLTIELTSGDRTGSN